MVNKTAVLSSNRGDAVVIIPSSVRAQLMFEMQLGSQLNQLLEALLPLIQRLHAQGDLAPNAAFLKASGQICGLAFLSDETIDMTVAEALERMEARLRALALEKDIVASAVFYHAVSLDKELRPAGSASEAATLIAMLEHADGQSFYLATPYTSGSGGPVYQRARLIARPPTVFVE